MICKSFENLSTLERIHLVGKLVHAIQSDEDCFNDAESLLTYAEGKGLFNRIKIMPNAEETTDTRIA